LWYPTILLWEVWDQGLNLDKPSDIIIEWLSVSLVTLEVLDRVGIDSFEALKVLSKLCLELTLA